MECASRDLCAQYVIECDKFLYSLFATISAMAIHLHTS